MERLGALLSYLERVLAPGSPEAPFAWLAVAALLTIALTLGVLVLRRRGGARQEVEHLFLASAAATRRAREISEIDAFARKASATAEDLKARVRRLRTRALPAGEDLHRPFQLHPHLDPDRAQP